MRVLLIRNLNPLTESSASGNRYSSIIQGLSREGVSVTLAVIGGYNNPEEFKRFGRKSVSDGIEIVYTVHTFSHNIWLRRLNIYLLNSIYAIINRKRLAKLLQNDFDFVFIAPQLSVLKCFNRLHDKIHAKTVIELNEYNDIYKYEGHVTNKLQLLQAEKENRELLSAIKRIDLFVVITRNLIDHFKKICLNENARFLHFPMTVDFSRFRDNIPGKGKFRKPYIAYTGALNNCKDGIDILIRAFALIRDRFPMYTLYLAGGRSFDTPGQIKLVHDLLLEENILFTGVLDRNEIPSFIQNASLLVLPRPDSYQARGGFPTKLGEYLVTGNPVCVTRVGEIPDYLEDNITAFMSEPGSVESFADSMIRALKDEENAKRVGRNGCELAITSFDIETQAKRLKAFLCENMY